MLVPKSVAGLLPLAALSAAQFHAVIDPVISREQIWDGLLPVMASTEATVQDWEAGWIFQSCKDEAEMRGYSASDFEVFDVSYSDCEEPWTMCRHREVNSPSKDEMIENFGKLPVHTREYVRHVIVMPDLGNGHAGLFYNYNIMFGDGNMDLYVLIHEATHCLDFGATDMSPISESSLWQDAYAQDSAAPTEYATSNWIEGFAEVGPLSFYDKYVEGGLAAIQPSISQIQNQLNVFREQLDGTITVGGTCENRLPPTEAVPMIEGARVMQALKNKPNTLFTSNVTVLDLPETPRLH